MTVRPESRKREHKSSCFCPPDRKPKVNFSPPLRPITTTRKRSVRLDVRGAGGGEKRPGSDGWIPRAVKSPNTSDGKSQVRIKPVGSGDAII